MENFEFSHFSFRSTDNRIHKVMHSAFECLKPVLNKVKSVFFVLISTNPTRSIARGQSSRIFNENWIRRHATVRCARWVSADPLSRIQCSTKILIVPKDWIRFVFFDRFFFDGARYFNRRKKHIFLQAVHRSAWMNENGAAFHSQTFEIGSQCLFQKFKKEIRCFFSRQIFSFLLLRRSVLEENDRQWFLHRRRRLDFVDHKKRSKNSEKFESIEIEANFQSMKIPFDFVRLKAAAENRRTFYVFSVEKLLRHESFSRVFSMNSDLCKIFHKTETDKRILSKREENVGWEEFFVWIWLETLFKWVLLTCFVRSDGLLNDFEQSVYSQG